MFHLMATLIERNDLMHVRLRPCFEASIFHGDAGQVNADVTAKHVSCRMLNLVE
jgi:hypothetical protein